MTRQVLGLDINDDFIAAVVVSQQGQERKIIAWAGRELGGRNPSGGELPGLLEELEWKGGPVVCGISLSGISLRNLRVPFIDRKKINQILPLELEDQLIIPVHEQVIEYILTEPGENSSRILVAAMDKKTLRRELDMLQSGGLSPRILTLRNPALTEAYRKSGVLPRDFMLLDAGLHVITMVIVNNGRIVFMRQLPCPERMFTREALVIRDGRAGIDNFDEVMACLDLLSREIQHNLGIFRIDSETEYHPEKVILTGIMSTAAEVVDKFSEALQLEVTVGDLSRDAGIRIREETGREWQPAIMDHALALALAGSTKKQLFNFRKGEFAPQKKFFTSRYQIAGAVAALFLVLGSILVFLAVDYRSLRTNHEQLGSRMEVLYRETFPEATRIQDPLAQMRANVRNIQAPSLATPVFSNEQRILNILADISARIPPEITIHVTRMVIDQDSVQIRGETDTFNNVNIIQSRLGGVPRFLEVNILSAAAEKDSGLIRFELRLRTGGRS